MDRPIYQKIIKSLYEKYDNGKYKMSYFYDENTKLEHLICYYENGIKKRETIHRDGSFCGPYEFYFENGSIQRKGNFSGETSKETNWIEYYYSGVKMHEKNEILYADTDCFKKYYENGKIMYEYNCLNQKFSIGSIFNTFPDCEKIKDYYYRYNKFGIMVRKIKIITPFFVNIDDKNINTLKTKDNIHSYYYNNGYIKLHTKLHNSHYYKSKKVIFY